MSKALQFFIEHLIVGTCALAGYAFVSQVSPDGSGLVEGTVFLAGAFLAGLVLHAMTLLLMPSVRDWAEQSWRNRTGKLPRPLADMRDELLARGGASVGDRINAHETMIRVAGGIAIAAILLALTAVIGPRPGGILGFGILALAAVFLVRRHMVELAEFTLTAWRLLPRPDSVAAVRPVATGKPATSLPDGVSVRTLIFAGGTAFRNCNIALARRGHRVTRVVPSWDNGGSSRLLREEFKVLSIGDIRQALMTMAHGENISNEVIRLFNCRLSEDGDIAELAAEMESYVRQENPRMTKVPEDLRNVILKYLETFWRQRPASLDLRNGSIGNFVMLGAYLAHGNDMNTAIYVFRQLCGIHGNVWPVTLENDLQLRAELADGQRLVGEEKVTSVDRSEVSHRLEKPYLVHGDQDQPASVVANPLVLGAFAHVDAIIFGPGSFFSSVLPHLMIKGVVDELARAKAPKIFVGNMLEGNECFGWSVAELVELFLATCHQFASEPRDADQYLTHIIAHDSSALRRNVQGDCYLALGDLSKFEQAGIHVSLGDYEDPWKRGAHDANVLAQHIIDAAR